MRFCGIDLHSNNSVVVVTDETDKVLPSRRCANDLQKIPALLAPSRDELRALLSNQPITGIRRRQRRYGSGRGLMPGRLLRSSRTRLPKRWPRPLF